jgi:hypothetical protein
MTEASVAPSRMIVVVRRASDAMVGVVMVVVVFVLTKK